MTCVTTYMFCVTGPCVESCKVIRSCGALFHYLVEKGTRSSPASVNQVLVVLARESFRHHTVRQRRLRVCFAVTYKSCLQKCPRRLQTDRRSDTVCDSWRRVQVFVRENGNICAILNSCPTETTGEFLQSATTWGKTNNFSFLCCIDQREGGKRPPDEPLASVFIGLSVCTANIKLCKK